MKPEDLAKLTPEEKRIRIAELCGWKFPGSLECEERFGSWKSRERWCLSPDHMEHFLHDVPDYLNDLNAMHEAEATLSSVQWYDIIAHVVGKRWDEAWSFDDTCALYHATAAQRADAFLLTLL